MRLGLAAGLLIAACGGGSKHAKPIVAAAPPTCLQAADHMKSLLPAPTSAKAGKLHDVLELRCTADAWAVDARVCIESTVSLDDPKHCKDKLTPPQRLAFDSDITNIDHPPRTESSTTVLDVDVRDWPDACIDYAHAMEALLKCDKYPQASREAMRDGFRSMAESLNSLVDDDPTMRDAMAESCKYAGDAVTQSSAGLGC